MSEPGGSNNPTDVPNPIDSAPALPSEPGPAVQTPGAQAPLPIGATQASVAQPAKTVFGMRQDANYYQPPQNVVFADDYEKRLPEDPYGEETAPNARIWRVYNEEAAAYDAVYVGQARDGLDVMLVFAGLFSAVVTSFLVQVSQSLQADYTSMSAILLYDLVTVQLSIADGASSRLNITVLSINPSQTFRPDSITVWVNGLWVVSLAMSLVVALSAVLVKQWFHHYTSIPSGTPGARSHLRQYRFDGLQKWRVNIIIGLFPIIMHTSLVLFLVGLTLFFIPLRTSLAYAVSVITLALCLLYLVSGALPIFFPQCPYQTPLTDFIYHIGLTIKNASRSLLEYIQRFVATCQKQRYRLFCRGARGACRAWAAKLPPSKGSPATFSALEMMAVKSKYDKLSIDTLDWLFNISSNPTVHSLVVQAIGGLPLDIQAHARETWKSQNAIKGVCQRLCDALSDSQHRAAQYDSVRERLNRLSVFYPEGFEGNDDGRYFYICPPVWRSTNFDEPRFVAAEWAATSEGTWVRATRSTRDLRKFFCAHNKLKLHPVIWQKLVQSALEIDSHCFQVDGVDDLSNPDYAYLVSLFLPAIFTGTASDDVSLEISMPTLSTGHCSTVTFHEALAFHVGEISNLESVQDCLLDMLSSFEDDLPATLPPRYRILYKVAKFTLRYLPREFWPSYKDGGSCRHLELLSDVLQSLRKEHDTILANHSCFFAPMLELLRTIIDDSSLCDYLTADMQYPKLHALLDDSLSAISRLLREMISSRQPQPGSVFPSFHRLLRVSAHDFSKDQHPKTVRETLYLMETALIFGNEEMHRAFIDGGWLWLLAERYMVTRSFPQYESISKCIRGRQKLDPASALEILDYLQQPRNFKIAFITVAQNLDSEVLLKLCPKDSSSSWDIHRATLDSILDWCQASDRDDLPLPFRGFFNGKVVQTSRGSVSLDEALRRIFTEDDTRRKVEWAARTIILGAAPW